MQGQYLSIKLIDNWDLGRFQLEYILMKHTRRDSVCTYVI